MFGLLIKDSKTKQWNLPSDAANRPSKHEASLLYFHYRYRFNLSRRHLQFTFPTESKYTKPDTATIVSLVVY